ncbi:MAG: alpha/beta hydrolase [Acidobacteria bacterium]|nr:alpha/beta hydrolase [Acidobacteriota bacterium]
MKALWLWFPRWLRIVFTSLAALIVVVGLAAASLWIYLNPSVDRTNGVVYGKRGERNLTMDILRPSHPNGLGIALMVSGGWKSQRAGETPVALTAPLLRAGYTVFAVCHISQPESTVMAIIEDMHRGLRFIRHNARKFAIDPNRIGVTGGSAGGHLSLMLATRGGAGDPNAADPVDRESSAVQAVAIFFPVTDLLNLGPSTENPGDGGPPISFVRGFGPDSKNMAVWKTIGRDSSPIYFVHKGQPPILIYHGDADTLVPLEQSQRFRQRASEIGLDVPLVVHPVGKHGWLTMLFDEREFVRWFDRYLGAGR